MCNVTVIMYFVHAASNGTMGMDSPLVLDHCSIIPKKPVYPYVRDAP